MNEILSQLNREFDRFSTFYYGAPVMDELIELRVRIEGWLLQNERKIKEYYWTRKREESMALNFCFKSFKIKLIFYNKGDFKISMEHFYQNTSTIDDKGLRNEFNADPGYVYFMESEFGWKIGKTRNLDNRKKVFDVKLPFPVAMRYFIKTHEITRLEAFLHECFKDKNINGEWFCITPDEIKQWAKENGDLRVRFYYPDKDILINTNSSSKCDAVHHGIAVALKGL